MPSLFWRADGVDAVQAQTKARHSTHRPPSLQAPSPMNSGRCARAPTACPPTRSTAPSDSSLRRCRGQRRAIRHLG
ncbi:hypothetical protein C8R44DRAFT_326345 [Mycena epipterygia]|nr:hypothetical protein C8R44DRAFT_326345 [Mycena epipterygia]